MLRDFGRTFAGWAIVLGLSSIAAAARPDVDDAGYYDGAGGVNYEQRLADLEAELASLRSRVDTGATTFADDGGCGSCGSCCDTGGSCNCGAGWGSCGCDPWLRCGLKAGIDAMWLKLHDSFGVQGANGTSFQADYELVYRGWVGYTFAEGLTVRGRYFDYNEDSFVVNGAVKSTVDLDTEIMDLDVYDTLNLGKWSVSLGGGLRYVEFDYGRGQIDEPTGRLVNGFLFASDNLGGSVFGEVRRGLFGNLTAFANSRFSAVFGEGTKHSGPTLVQFDFAEDTVKFMWESQLGLEYGVDTNVGYLFGRGAFEMWYWNNFHGEPFFDYGEALGFSGLSFSVGILR
jgi:hypothetical protein